jgi:oligopeptide/dipeptide ABC transporter ATP-binding protein
LSIDIHKPGKGRGYLNSVKDINFDIYPGEILGIVGESGSGKSLTALSIPGLLGANKDVSTGAITFNGERSFDLLNISEKEKEKIRGKEISIIFQESFSSLNPLVRIGKQIAEVPELHKEKMDKKEIKAKVLDLLTKLKFPEPGKIFDALPHHLSGGMCQRVMIAIAVISGPRLLIADEPTTALDPDTQKEIISLLKEINREYKTSILFISHDLALVRNFCDRIIVMYSGRILEEGDTDEVFLHPAHEYTKGLIGSIPKPGNDLMNIPGKIPSLEEGRPSGCPFHPRCQKFRSASDEKTKLLCTKEFPQERLVGTNHKTHCVITNFVIESADE